MLKHVKQWLGDHTNAVSNHVANNYDETMRNMKVLANVFDQIAITCIRTKTIKSRSLVLSRLLFSSSIKLTFELSSTINSACAYNTSSY